MDSTATTSTITYKAETGSHMLKISGYSLTKGIGIGKFICSNVFTVGGYNWVIRFYPDGVSIKFKDSLSLYLQLISPADVKARFAFTILLQDDTPSDIGFSSKSVYIFKERRSLGFCDFVGRNQFEASEYLKDDAFTIKCTIDVVTYPKDTTNYSLTVPPSNLTPDMVHLLESGQGSDVAFVVKGERFKAHRCVLAARSAVFNAQLFGCLKGKWKKTIKIDDIEPAAFKSMLYFIYSDSLPHFEKQDLKLMAQQLLIAADRYDLERLKMMSAELLSENLDTSTVASTLFLAERHNCYHLKAKCLEFMSTRKALLAVAATDGFHHLMKNFPSILQNI